LILFYSFVCFAAATSEAKAWVLSLAVSFWKHVFEVEADQQHQGATEN
jgi:hypothetical protein